MGVFSPLVLVTISFLICDRLIKIRLAAIFHISLPILKGGLNPGENKENLAIRLVSWNKNDRLHVLHFSNALFTFAWETSCGYIKIGVVMIIIKTQQKCKEVKSQALMGLLVKEEHEGDTEIEGEWNIETFVEEEYWITSYLT